MYIVMMANKEFFITPGTGGLVSGRDHTLKNFFSTFGGWFRQTQKQPDYVPIDSYCKNSLYCSLPLPLLI